MNLLMNFSANSENVGRHLQNYAEFLISATFDTRYAATRLVHHLFDKPEPSGTALSLAHYRHPLQ